ncbi:ATP-grasp domain-containing protein [Actinoplanes couchii]|uniref:ATP-grasp domain-containing protein n=1 Tax=Actinoplanes couchii TaxID=403638 RepID=A0ABQ3XSE1_9ACTN|nr:hypothetical protein [Actinoplanes couchii]MDR6315916.1 biotin carboxylase [Actinoplanes couchii]GID61434.1 hypothetical protein Aco03nite_098380 [Actinoplanes couchii]
MYTVVLGANFQTMTTLRNVPAPVVVVGSGRFPRLTEVPESAQWHVPVDDHTSTESVLMGLARLPSSVAIGSVYTQDEYAMVTAAAVASALGVRGPDPAVACRFRDKTLQKATVRATGLPVADWCELEGDLEEMVAQCDVLEYPLVIKPVAGAGTVDTELVSTSVEARSTISRVCASRPGVRIMAEAFQDAAEGSLDGLVVDGRIAFLGVERYLFNLLKRGSRGMGGVVADPKLSPELYARANDFAARVVAALGMRRGSFHMEVFDGPDGFILGECAARLGGLYIPLAYRHKFGVDLHSEAFRLHLAGEADHVVVPTRRDEAVGWALLACPLGEIKAVPSSEEMRTLPGVVDCGVYVHPGERAPDMSLSSTTRAGQILVEGPDEEAVEERLEYVARYFTEACRVA